MTEAEKRLIATFTVSPFFYVESPAPFRGHTGEEWAAIVRAEWRAFILRATAWATEHGRTSRPSVQPWARPWRQIRAFSAKIPAPG